MKLASQTLLSIWILSALFAKISFKINFVLRYYTFLTQLLHREQYCNRQGNKCRKTQVNIPKVSTDKPPTMLADIPCCVWTNHSLSGKWLLVVPERWKQKKSLLDSSPLKGKFCYYWLKAEWNLLKIKSSYEKWRLLKSKNFHKLKDYILLINTFQRVSVSMCTARIDSDRSNFPLKLGRKFYFYYC